ncbi:MAG: signal peptide peptidase SppA [Candidatus Cryptobacteroides sp.]|nr:signal peptide peptidase SppA [Bacteroidales bacterium]MDY5494446.1 signal peptide peptidase SppA [Candidatus Cryptobacteroides sp.]
MKDFLKMTLAVLAGLFIAGILGFMLFFGFIGTLASLGSSTPAMPRSGVLFMDMSRISIAEQTQETDPMAMIQGQDISIIGLWDAVKAIEKAASDPAVQCIYLKADGLSAGGIAPVEELRQALGAFRLSGKPVVAYTENPGTGSYYLASVADKIYMGSYKGGSNMMVGVGTQMIFLKDLLDKLGVNVQLIRHGKFKSAGEMYIKSRPSEENLLQTREMVNSMWDGMAESICSSREISREDLDGMIDNLKLNTPEDFLACRLVDELLTKEELKEKLAVLAKESKYEEVKFISLRDYVNINAQTVSKARRKIAIIYAEGEIIDGYDKQEVAGDRFAGIISSVRADSTVKAVVLRVASPGGSVAASEKIRTEIDLLRKVKPVIASYGNYAASGGYWISNSCDKIFSDKSTLTGSIGVFSMIPDLSGTAEKVFHVGVTNVGSSKHSDMYSLTRPLDAEETAFMQKSVDDIYEAFLENVSAGRGMDKAEIDEIAQGRVWTGSDALKIGLVDEIGTLADAVRYAAIAAGDTEADLGTWEVAAYPKPMTTLDIILENLTGSTDALAGTPFESVGRAFRSWDATSTGKVYARMPYIMEIK